MAAHPTLRTRQTRPVPKALINNPMLALPSMQRLLELDPLQKEILADILADLRRDADNRAEKSWARRKGPMASYWRVVSTYAGHVRRALRAT